MTLVSGVNTATARATIVFGARLTSGSWASPVTLAWAGGMLLGTAVILTMVIARVRPRAASS